MQSEAHTFLEYTFEHDGFYYVCARGSNEATLTIVTLRFAADDGVTRSAIKLKEAITRRETCSAQVISYGRR